MPSFRAAHLACAVPRARFQLSSRFRRTIRFAAALAAAVSLHAGFASAQSGDSTAAPPAPTPSRSFALTGRVLDRAGQPISQVSIGIAEIRRGANTGEDGRYTIPALPPGTYSVSFQRIGYAPVVRRFVLNAASATLDVTLGESAIELPATQVTASASATTPLTSPQPVSVLTGEALRQAQAPSLGATLEQLPGLRSWSTGTGVGKPAIRGLRSDRVVITANELRLENQGWGDEHGPQIETSEVERVEVIRGPGSVLYGSDALGGVVNVIPRRLPVAFGRSPFVTGQVQGAYGSVDENREGGLALEGAAQGFGFRGSFASRRSDDVRTPGGRLSNSGNESATGGGAVGLRGARGSIDLAYTRRVEDVEIHEDPAEDPLATPHQRITDDLTRISAILPLGERSRLETHVGYEENRRREYEAAGDPVVALGLVAKTLSGIAHWHHPPVAGLEGMLGLSYQNARFRRFGEEALIPASDGTDAGVFAFEEAEFGKWRFALGARWDRRTLDVEADADLAVTEQRRDWNAISGSAGVVYRVAEPVAVVASLGRGFRAPSNFDLFSNGVHEGTIAFERGNPALDVETSLNGDLSVRVQMPLVTAEAGGFVNEIDDFIYTRPTGEIDVDSGFEIFETVQGNARLAGYEVAAEIHPVRHLHLSLSSDFVRGDNTETDTPLPWIPPVRALYAMRYEADSIGVVTGVYLGLRGESVAKQTRLDPLDTTVSGYTLFHAEAGLEVPLGGRALTLDVGVRNLTDRAYRDFMSRLKTYADAPGRNVTVRLTTGF